MNQYEQIKAALDRADGVLIGASNGLSISEGYNIFADDQWFREHFGDFRRRYGIRNILQGTFYQYPSPQIKWAFFARLMALVSFREPTPIMKNLYRLVKEKDYFLVSSNGEGHFVPAGFDPDRVFELEGRMTQWVCSHHCRDEVFEAPRQQVLEMARLEQDGFLPAKALPRCPHCGQVMDLHIAGGDWFFNTSHYREKQRAYRRFVLKHQGKRLVLLELGVGWRNVMIKEPFMQLAAMEPQATYVTFNKGEIYIPERIASKSIGVDGDIAAALEALAALG